MKPFIKWAGGKRQLAKRISELLDIASLGTHCYFEPFVGAGAVLFYNCPDNAVAFDVNPELMNFYNVVKNSARELVEEYNRSFAPKHSEKFFYEVREMDRQDSFRQLPCLFRAARFLYLNKNCFNGLWRENAKGQNNCPWNKEKKAAVVKLEDVECVSDYLNRKGVSFNLGDYTSVEALAKAGDIVYFDPPYDKEKGQNGYTGYTKSGFNQADQVKLKELCDRLVAKGVVVGVSNSNTKHIRGTFSEGPVKYQFYDMKARRSVGANGETRKEITELFILGINHE